jgi:hypothetical protein
MTKEKKLKEITIFQEQKKSPITWKDIKHVDLQDDDELNIQWNEPYYSENNSWDGHYSVSIRRNRLETDEEFQKRLEREERDLKRQKEIKYNTYLKLKSEFEG